MLPTIWGVYVSWIYMLILDISCQHLGDDCKLEGFCVPFGHRVGNVHLWKYIFVLDICRNIPQNMGVTLSAFDNFEFDNRNHHFWYTLAQGFPKIYHTYGVSWIFEKPNIPQNMGVTLSAFDNFEFGNWNHHFWYTLTQGFPKIYHTYGVSWIFEKPNLPQNMGVIRLSAFDNFEFDNQNHHFWYTLTQGFPKIYHT